MMNTIHHRIGVFPIEVRPAFWVLCLVFGLMDLDSGATVFQALFLAPVLYLSVLTHEMGHALAARSMGQTVYSISLHGMGGTTVHTRPKSGTVRTLISIAGPAFGFGLAFVLGVAALNTPAWRPPASWRDAPTSMCFGAPSTFSPYSLSMVGKHSSAFFARWGSRTRPLAF